MPKFADIRAWEQAELLMQPVFIRVIANIGKLLEDSRWKGEYQEAPVWAEDIPESVKQRFLSLQKQLQTATPEEADEIRDELARLPSPHPGYWLCLVIGDRQITMNIWELCYQICFRNYSPVLNALDKDLIVEIDTSLINDYGDVDWQRLDEKAKQVIGQIFASLSGQSSGEEGID